MAEAACNEANCTCPKTECPRHGKCCECVNHHRKVGSLVVCLREIGAEAAAKAQQPS